MKVKASQQGQVSVVEVEGRVDSTTSADLEKKLLDLFETGNKFFVIDFARVDYISSAGLRVLIMAAKKSKAAGGKVVLSALRDTVQEVFDLAGFSSIFAIFGSPEEAVRSF